MAADIETLLRQAEKNGLTAFTVWPSGKGWQCNARFRRGKGQDGWVCVKSDDMLAGAREALGGKPDADPAPRIEEDAFG